MPQSPLPSEVLGSANGGRGVSGFVLRATDLDRLPQIVDEPSDTHATCRAIQAGERDAAEEHADALRAEVARLTGLLDERVPAADRARLIRERDDYRQRLELLDADLARYRAEWEKRSAAGREQVDRLVQAGTEARAEVADLRRELAETRAHRDRLIEANADQARQLRVARHSATLTRVRSAGAAPDRLVIPETFLPTPEHPAALRVFAAGLVEYDGHELRVTYDAPPQVSDGYLDDAETYEPDPSLGAPPEVVALMRVDRILGNEVALSEQGTGRIRGIVLGALNAWAAARSGGLPADGSVEADPRRPHPDAWPDDAVLLRYRELRDLVALHLDRYGDARSARAMRDGDVPLRLAEVLRP